MGTRRYDMGQGLAPTTDILENDLMIGWGRRLGRAAGTVALVLAASRAGLAVADVNGYVSATGSYDDNLFRAPDGVSFLGVSRSDDLFGLGGGGTFSLTNEHFQLNASGDVGQNWYDRNRFLNSLAYDGTLEFTERQKFIDLDVQASENHALSSFADLRTPIKNLQSVTRTAARVGLAATSDVKVVFDVKFNRDTNTNAQIAEADYNQTVIGAGLGYFSPSGNSLVLEELRTYTKGVNLQEFLINDFLIGSKINYFDDTTMVQLSYSPSPLTTLFAQAGYLRRTDQSIFHNNVTAPVGALRFSYRPDTVVEIDISAGRQLASQSYLIVEGITDSYIKANPSFRFPNGLKASFDFNYDHRSYGLLPEFGLNSGRTTDQSMRYDATLSYQILDNYQIALSGYHEERHSDTLFDTYTDNGLMITLTLRSARPAVAQGPVDQSDYLLLP